ncbi:MAG: phosphoglycerate kinase [Pantoea sp. Brub]|nr:phosphoglycerate kinase [Pantoea sp. Brub]
MYMIRMTDINLHNKRVLIRADLNVPMHNGNIVSDARIISSLPAIKIALAQGAKVMLTSHLGRPIEGIYDNKYSLGPIAHYLKYKFNNINITLIKDYLNNLNINVNNLNILENVRFNKGEQQNDDSLSKRYASLCDIFVMDAFATSHRINSSTYGVIKYAPMSCIGPLFSKEIESINKIMIEPQRPLVAIVGGSKVSSKFHVLESLAKLADTIIVGGGIANTFISIDNKIGKSLHESNFINQAKMLRSKYNFLIPSDLRVGKNFSKLALSNIKNVSDIADDEYIMDIGDKTLENITNVLKKAKTILWNGPIGVFEFPNFCKGTKIIAESIANSNAFSVAGGGDTLAIIDLFNIKDKISYISTGGGAFLKFIESNNSPVIDMLERYSK